MILNGEFLATVWLKVVTGLRPSSKGRFVSVTARPAKVQRSGWKLGACFAEARSIGLRESRLSDYFARSQTAP